VKGLGSLGRQLLLLKFREHCILGGRWRGISEVSFFLEGKVKQLSSNASQKITILNCKTQTGQ
jgi:hypothetical protein